MKRQAFTLIELLVVIAIIAILLAILMPGLNLARDQGRKMKCSSNLHSIALANQLYSNNNDDWSVPCRYIDDLGTTLWTPHDEFRDYIGYEGAERNLSGVQTPKKYKCPSDRQDPEEQKAAPENPDAPCNRNRTAAPPRKPIGRSGFQLIWVPLLHFHPCHNIWTD